MAKQSSKNPNTPSPTYPVPTQEFSPEWFEANKESLAAAGYQVVSKQDFQKKIHNETAAEEAAKELLGLDVNTERPRAHMEDAASHELWDFLTKVKIQMDLIMESTQFRSLMAPVEREQVHAIRVFLRQIFGEKAPVGQASTIRELFGAHAKLPDGVMGDRVRRTAPKKAVKIDHRHLQQAGVTD